MATLGKGLAAQADQVQKQQQALALFKALTNPTIEKPLEFKVPTDILEYFERLDNPAGFAHADLGAKNVTVHSSAASGAIVPLTTAADVTLNVRSAQNEKATTTIFIDPKTFNPSSVLKHLLTQQVSREDTVSIIKILANVSPETLTNMSERDRLALMGKMGALPTEEEVQTETEEEISDTEEVLTETEEEISDTGAGHTSTVQFNKTKLALGLACAAIGSFFLATTAWAFFQPESFRGMATSLGAENFLINLGILTPPVPVVEDTGTWDQISNFVSGFFG